MKESDYTFVDVIKNGETIFRIYDSNDADRGVGNNISYTWMMNLGENDRINLDSVRDLYASSNSPVTFTGELIHF